MKTTSELTDFYYKTLFPTLETLEEDRKKLRQKIIKVGVFYTFIVVLLSLVFLSSHINFDIIVFLLFAYIGIGLFIYKMLIKDYTKDFKHSVIEPLIKEIDRNLSYTPELCVREHTFTRSKLYKKHIDRFRGNDYVRGTIDGIDIEFSDIHAEYRSKNSKNKSWHTIFQGLFIVSDFHKHFKGETIVLPDNAQSTFGDLIGNWLQSNNFARDELVKMDNPEFEKEFVVYSNDQVEARYVLTHTLMQRLLIFKKRSGHPLGVSFIGGNIYIAIEYNKDLFEPSIFHSLLKYKIAMEYVSTLHLAIGIIEELKLNQKIWSKQ
ncbi:DUF3137 domain-containing protein [Sulfurimonas aquatica]|uniref:DUF3137 domain-containing protein n=1 Tax=Sulfurimonas aquatica TaxID=2672570 RepID=A0A975GD23_9BACT|nr:DUF3137 domain-containing protein [Sulfurimonas aquatica]QSZ42127.1 DUF3137 domain-containing protein [Sulfurimonas aquatica]